MSELREAGGGRRPASLVRIVGEAKLLARARCATIVAGSAWPAGNMTREARRGDSFREEIRMYGPRGLREALRAPGIIVAPGAYDAVSARLVETAGFRAAYTTSRSCIHVKTARCVSTPAKGRREDARVCSMASS
jgi:hypothetical protein